MSNRFTRNINNVRKIDKLPLHTNVQNDLISDINGNVYVRTLNKYVRITGFEFLEDDLSKLKNQVDALEPNNTNTSEIIEGIKSKQKQLNDELQKIKQQDEVSETEIEKLKQSIEKINVDIGKVNYDSEISWLQDQIDNLNNQEDKEMIDQQVREDLKSLQDQVDSIVPFDEQSKQKLSDLETQLTTLSEKITKNETTLKTVDTNIKKNTTDIKSLDTLTKTHDTSLKSLETSTSNLSKKFDGLISDTKWKNLTLINDVIPYSDDETPQYRITNVGGVKEVSLRGAVKNVKDNRTIIANLPIEDELTQQHVFTQPTSLKTIYDNEKIAVFNRWAVRKNKDIVLENFGFTTQHILTTGGDWCPLNTTFKI